jgi:hypothetical protein
VRASRPLRYNADSLKNGISMKIRTLCIACVTTAAVLLVGCTAVYKNTDACEQMMRSKLADVSPKQLPDATTGKLSIDHRGTGIDGTRVVVEASLSAYADSLGSGRLGCCGCVSPCGRCGCVGLCVGSCTGPRVDRRTGHTRSRGAYRCGGRAGEGGHEQTRQTQEAGEGRSRRMHVHRSESGVVPLASAEGTRADQRRRG